MESVYDVVPRVEEIEIVPRFLLPVDDYCLAEGVLGVHDRQLYRRYTELCVSSSEYSTPSTTFVAVLASPENVTALNARKRMCLSGRIAWEDELRLTGVLLRSHLYRHCKSAFLWHHRRWVLQNGHLSTSVEAEFALVCRAAEHHPKNYFAWTYMQEYCTYTQQRPPLEAVRELAMRNLSDVSIWSFVGWLGDHDFARDTDLRFPGHAAIKAAIPSTRHTAHGEHKLAYHE